MDIPFSFKLRPDDLNCASVCLKMALAYFDITVEQRQIDWEARGLGPRYFALPWGIYLAAANRDLYVTFISKHPYALTNADVIAAETRMTGDAVRLEAQRQVTACRASTRIDLVPYDQNIHDSLPATVATIEMESSFRRCDWMGH